MLLQTAPVHRMHLSFRLEKIWQLPKATYFQVFLSCFHQKYYMAECAYCVRIWRQDNVKKPLPGLLPSSSLSGKWYLGFHLESVLHTCLNVSLRIIEWPCCDLNEIVFLFPSHSSIVESVSIFLSLCPTDNFSVPTQLQHPFICQLAGALSPFYLFLSSTHLVPCLGKSNGRRLAVADLGEGRRTVTGHFPGELYTQGKCSNLSP